MTDPTWAGHKADLAGQLAEFRELAARAAAEVADPATSPNARHGAAVVRDFAESRARPLSAAFAAMERREAAEQRGRT